MKLRKASCFSSLVPWSTCSFTHCSSTCFLQTIHLALANDPCASTINESLTPATRSSLFDAKRLDVRLALSLRSEQEGGKDERVDVLREDTLQETVLLEQKEEEVCDSRQELARVELLGELERCRKAQASISECLILRSRSKDVTHLVERLRIRLEVVNVKHRLRMRQIVFLQVGVEARFGRPKVGDAGVGRDARSREDDNLLGCGESPRW